MALTLELPPAEPRAMSSEPTLDRAVMLERFFARDTAYDGRFIVGVVTTGIFCLPSCKARKPRPENVRFFADPDGARGVGLRACKRCRPEEFYAHEFPEREGVRDLVRRLRRAPADFPTVGELAADLDVGTTKLAKLTTEHLHTTPSAVLTGARVAHAASALVSVPKRRLVDVALDAGFESSSTFHEQFKRRMGLSPRAYSKLGERSEFSLALPDGFRRQELWSMLGRDPEGRAERVEGKRATKAVVLRGVPTRLELEFRGRGVRCRVVRRGRLTRRAMAEAHGVVLRLCGLGTDPGPFERRVRRMRGMGRLVRGRAGLRIPQTADVFEGLVWVIVGQQVNLAFAAECRDRLIELCGTDAGGGFRAHPTAEAVAQLDYSELTDRKYSRRKAEYLIDTARAISAGELELEELRGEPATLAEERLTGVRGLGPWSVNYLLMRSLGFADCVPLGDAGLVSSLETFFGLDGRPDARETARLMQPFAPHRSLATFHLWKRLGDPQ